LLIEALGPGVVANLARTAQLAAADSAVLDDLAAGQAAATSSGAASLSVAALSELPAAVLTRVLRRYAHELGVPAGALALVHIDALAALVTSWRGQGPVALPGGVWVRRCNGRIEPHAGPVAGHSQVHPR
jgi:tRNA(Ile)-lysidine synthase